MLAQRKQITKVSTSAAAAVDARAAAGPGCRNQDGAHQRVAATPPPVDELRRERADRPVALAGAIQRPARPIPRRAASLFRSWC